MMLHNNHKNKLTGILTISLFFIVAFISLCLTILLLVYKQFDNQCSTIRNILFPVMCIMNFINILGSILSGHYVITKQNPKKHISQIYSSCPC